MLELCAFSMNSTLRFQKSFLYERISLCDYHGAVAESHDCFYSSATAGINFPHIKYIFLFSQKNNSLFHPNSYT